MMLIPKTLKTKIVLKNHITIVSGGAAAGCLLSTVFFGLFVVHPFFKFPFILVNVALIWFAIFPSKWNADITRAELLLKFIFTNRSNSKSITKEEVILGVRYYEKGKKDKETDKRRKEASARSY